MEGGDFGSLANLYMKSNSQGNNGSVIQLFTVSTCAENKAGQSRSLNWSEGRYKESHEAVALLTFYQIISQPSSNAMISLEDSHLNKAKVITLA